LFGRGLRLTVIDEAYHYLRGYIDHSKPENTDAVNCLKILYVSKKRTQQLELDLKIEQNKVVGLLKAIKSRGIEYHEEDSGERNGKGDSQVHAGSDKEDLPTHGEGREEEGDRSPGTGSGDRDTGMDLV
jgi:hypothetical protein